MLRVRDYIFEKLWSILFLLFTFLLCFCLIITHLAQIIVNWLHSESYTQYFFATLIIFASISLFFSALDSVQKENAFQLFAFVILTFGLTMRITYQLSQIEKEPSLFYFILIPAIIVYLSQIAFLLLWYPVYRKFGWVAYEQVGTSPTLYRAYQWYQAYLAIMKLDIEGMIAITLMGTFILNVSLTTVTWSFVGYILLGIYTLVSAVISVSLGIRKEWIPVQIIYIFLLLVYPLFILYNVLAIWMFPQALNTEIRPEEITEMKVIFTVISVFSLLIRIIFIVVSIWIMKHFGKGMVEVHAKTIFLVPDFIAKRILSKRNENSKDFAETDSLYKNQAPLFS